MGQMKDFKEFDEAVASVLQRKKLARRMSKMARSPAMKMKKKRAALRMRTPGKLALLARKKTIQKFRDKFYPTYGGMALQQRVIVDNKIMQKYGAKIDKISKKLLMKLKKTELERVKKARAALKENTGGPEAGRAFVKRTDKVVGKSVIPHYAKIELPFLKGGKPRKSKPKPPSFPAPEVRKRPKYHMRPAPPGGWWDGMPGLGRGWANPAGRGRRDI